MSTKLVALFATLLLLLLPPLQAQVKPVPVKSGRAHPTQILARYAEGASASARAAVLAAEEVQVKRQFPRLPGLVLLNVNEAAVSTSAALSPEEQGRRLEDKIARLQATGLFRYVEPDYIQTALAVPTDASFTDGTLWGLRNTGQSGGVPGADIDAVRAWDLTTGSTDVIVAVIDSGIRYTHRDLAAQMWRNPGEIPGNGVDDDQDGYVDNVFGINAINGSGDPLDDNDHGTHCAGTIGAAANDVNPHVGVAWQVRLMGCKFLGADGSGATSDAIRCVTFAVSKGAKILSNSWGGGGFSQGLFDAIADAQASGVLFVAAAGNDSANNDAVASYPANYDLDNVISVAALDRQDKLADFSNYGAATVDLGAPGVAIYSSTSGSDTEYKLFNGTSMATPHVSGVAALVLARFPDLPLAEMRQRLLGTVVPVAALRGRTVTGGRVNAYNAVNATPDGQLELNVAAAGGELIGGRDAILLARVTDLFAVSNAVVTASIAGQPAPVFRNDGVAPDETAADGTYSATLAVPTAQPELTLTVTATAPGKTPATNLTTFTVIIPPANDQFADRAPLTGAVTQATGSNRAATKEPGEPAHAGNAGGRSVWWTWTASATGLVTLHTEGSDFDTTLAVYQGGVVNALVRVAADDDSGAGVSSRVTFNAAAGTAYQIAVDGYDGRAGAVELSLRLDTAVQEPPPNDQFANRAVLTGTTVSANAATLGAAREAGEPEHAGNAGGRSAWWTWTAPVAGEVTLHTEGSDFDTLLAVYTGSSLAALNLVAADDDSGEGSRSRLTFLAAAGTMYQIAVDGRDGTGGSARLNLAQSTPNPVPPNDDFAGRAALAGSAPTANGRNEGASKEPGEASHADNAGGRSVWWTWTLPEDGEVSIHTAGSDFDTLLAVYVGDAVNALNLIAQNDQDPAGGVTSRVTFAGVAGATYQIVVDGANTGFAAATGNIVLTASIRSVGTGPANDAFAARQALTGDELRVAGFNFGATAEPGEPGHAGFFASASVWWTWMSPTPAQVVVDTAGSDFDTLLAVYTGAALGALTPIAANDDGPFDRTSVVRFNARAGVPYHFAVDGYLGLTGVISLGLRATEGGGAPPNDNFAARASLTGSLVTLTASNEGATREPGEPAHAGDSGGASVWWTWTAPATGPVTVNTDGSGFDTLLAVYAGDTLDALSLVAEDDDGGLGTRSLVNFVALAGTTYQLAVDGYGGVSGTVTLNLIQAGAQPSSDDFATAIVVEGAAFTVTGGNAEATREPGEPLHAGSQGNRSVWWRWTAPATATVTLLTEGSGFDTSLGIYTGDDVAALSEVESNEDSGFDVLSSAVTFTAVEGQTYHLAVDGYSDGGPTATGNIALGLIPLAEAADTPGWEWTVTGQHWVWHAQRGVTHDGRSALRSGYILDNEASALETTVTGPGTLRFWWKVSSEESFDFLTFQLDGLEQAAISGEQNWHRLEFPVGEGVHVLTWSYLKDESELAGSDAGWLDEVSFAGFGDPPQIVTGPAGQTVNPGSAATLTVTVTGTEPLAYVWRRNGEPVPNANGPTLNLPDFQPGQAGDYTVEVSNAFGQDTSDPAHVVLLATAPVVMRPAGLTAPGFRLTAQVQPGRDYRVQASTAFGPWTDLERFTSTGPEFEFNDPLAPGLPWRFYRVVSP